MRDKVKVKTFFTLKEVSDSVQMKKTPGVCFSFKRIIKVIKRILLIGVQLRLQQLV